MYRAARKPNLATNGGYWFLDQGGATPFMRE
jgi:hypothetical protein